MVIIYMWNQYGSTQPRGYSGWESSYITYGDGINGSGKGDGEGAGELCSFPDGDGFGAGISNSVSGSGPLL